MMVRIILILVDSININTVTHCIITYKMFTHPLNKHFLNAQHREGHWFWGYRHEGNDLYLLKELQKGDEQHPLFIYFCH